LAQNAFLLPSAQPGPQRLGRLKQTTTSSCSPSGFVTITRPNHPLCGQQVEIIRIRRGIDPDLIVRLPDGQHVAIAMSGTDYSNPGQSAASLSIPHLLDFQGLLQTAELVEHMIPQDHTDPSILSRSEL
jgi:hypothetical protein